MEWWISYEAAPGRKLVWRVGEGWWISDEVALGKRPDWRIGGECV